MDHLAKLLKNPVEAAKGQRDDFIAAVDRAFGNDYFFGDPKDDELDVRGSEAKPGKPGRDDINAVPWRSKMVSGVKGRRKRSGPSGTPSEPGSPPDLGLPIAEVGDSKTTGQQALREFADRMGEEYGEVREIDPTSLQGNEFGPNGLNFGFVDGSRTYKLKYNQSRNRFEVFGSCKQASGSRTWETRWKKLQEELFTEPIRKNAMRKTAAGAVAKFEATFRTKRPINARSVAGDYGEYGHEVTVGGDKGDLTEVSVDPDRGEADEFYFSGALNMYGTPLSEYLKDEKGWGYDTEEEAAEEIVREILSESLESLYGRDFQELEITSVQIHKQGRRKTAEDQYLKAPPDLEKAIRGWQDISSQFKMLQGQYKDLEAKEKGAREQLGNLMNELGMRTARVDDLMYEYKESTRINYPYSKMWAEALKKVNKETQKALQKMADDMAGMSSIRTVKSFPVPRGEEEGPQGPEYVEARRSKLVQAGIWSTIKSWGRKLMGYLDRTIDILERGLSDMRGERVASRNFEWGIGDEFQMMEPYKAGVLTDVVPGDRGSVVWKIAWKGGGTARVETETFDHMTRSGAVIKTSTFEDWVEKLLRK